MKRLIKRILKQYLAHQCLKHKIQQAFLSKYLVTDYVRGSAKIARKYVHQDIEESLRIPANRHFRHFQTQALKEIGVVPVFAEGYRYFSGLIKK